ncbi:MAG: hypothetical protein K9N09_01920 [Candidatus Cloacimonetes bacterium]|nr:hypothetical protein [Candidatus Cloacimonadota bacterium]MCF7813232.1 hypothetical protein [Candidatus Cloacimonadota bacterium]MCF7867431.1 hypothetical protein [Candidatus Cloacimonadota bacterium]MCF7882937.1 hypothetical protein [Candidatus Cloacimonadota bacterium]
MKRVLLLLILILITGSSFANIFIDMYHKDYGVINRSVLVFSSKPEYKIIENENDIQLNIVNCTKDINIQNQQFLQSAVIESFDYYSTEDKVMVIISINSQNQLEKQTKYSLEKYEIEDEVYKLILDVYATKTPKTYQEYNSFAYFFEATGKPDTARPYREMANKLKEELPPETVIQQDQQITQQQQQQQSSKNRLVRSIQNFLTPGTIILIIIAIILIAAITFTLAFVLKKKTAGVVSNKSLRLTSGFGSEEFRRNLIQLLEKNFWGAEEIALELEMSTNDVYRSTAPEFAEELEKEE